MILFCIKTLVALIMIAFAFLFYGNVEDYLFIKLVFCVFILLAMYWVDIYRLSRIFGTYFIAVHNFKVGKTEKSFYQFERLLNWSFAPSLPYLALMKFKGIGTNVNVDAAKYYCERAIRNDYFEYLYLLAVIDFFGDSLTDYFKGEKRQDSMSDAELHAAGVKTYREVANPDYRECVFHLHWYMQHNNQKDKFYPEACALLGYCLLTGKGIEQNISLGKDFIKQAQQLQSKNVEHLIACWENGTDVKEFYV